MPGQPALVKAVHAAEHLAHRLAALGFRSGKPLQVQRRGSLSGPVQVRLGTTDVILRRTEAAHIEVELREVEPAPIGAAPDSSKA